MSLFLFSQVVLLGGGQEAMKVITTTTIAGKIEALFIHLVFEEEIRHVKGHFSPIKFYPDDKRCWLNVYTHTCKQVNYSHVYVHVDRKHFGDFYEGITWQSKNDTTKLITTFHSESTVHSNDINISYCEKTQNIGKNSFIIDLAFHQNFSILTVYSKH